MSYSIALRYKDSTYSSTFQTNISFGGAPTSVCKIPGLTSGLLFVQVQGGGVQITTSSPLPKTQKFIEFNQMTFLDPENTVSLYVSRFAGPGKESIELPYRGTIEVGRSIDNDLVLSFPVVSRKHFQIRCENGSVYVRDSGSTYGLFLNGKKINQAVLHSGDVISICTFRFIYREGKMYFENMGEGLKISSSLKNPAVAAIVHEAVKPSAAKPVYTPDAQPAVPKAYAAPAPAASSPVVSPAAPAAVDYSNPSCSKALYLNYHLSPRIREKMPTEGLILSAAPGAATTPSGRQGNAAYMISSGAMFAASLASGMVSPAMLLARVAGFFSPIANMMAMKKMSKEERAQFEEYEKMRQERYTAYIAEQKARIRKISDVQKRILTTENPSPASCLATVQNLRRNLWERTIEDSDFLVTRLGIGPVPLCVEVKTRADVDGFKMVEEDELEKMSSQIIEETKYVEDMPVCVDLRKNHLIGLVGKWEDTRYVLRNLIVEMVSEHCFTDVHLAGLFDESAMSSFGILRWLPHVWDESDQSRFLAFTPEHRHVVCEMLLELIRSRRSASQDENGRPKAAPFPHYIVVVQSRDLIEKEEVFQDLTSADPLLGITVLILGESLYAIPQKAQILVECRSTMKGCIYEKNSYDQRTDFTIDSVIHQKEMEGFCRRMAAIELSLQKSQSPIPSSVTFLQGYGVKRVEELDVWNRWSESKPYQSLAAPIGVMEGGKLFSLDVRSGEQAHGPHGLLAGTTGSGKSELLQSWILSMALNFHPYDVNFVIIDYKGGGMSDLMEPLPHVVGKITNIDRNIARSLVSLKSELRRRQELFAKAGVNNIDKYQKAFEEGMVKERLPHLIIVTDEFAEMKKEEPEFLAELNSVAAVGRSLGIHMLLATQKPAGVVTDQINSNSRFRICMKVQDLADSREMIGRGDAAKITQAGRAYVRVGEDELFELFQSFYSGAMYGGEKTSGEVHENRVRLVTSTGERLAMTRSKHRGSSDEIDELTAIIQHINQICKEKGIKKMNGPWLPELKKWLTVDDLYLIPSFDGKKWQEEYSGLSVPIGQYDIPAVQKQGILYMDFMEMGHFGVFGIPGSGKTTLLKTVVTNLGKYYNPKQVEITILDAANWSMKELSAMPHVREVVLNSDEEKLMAFIQRMKKEIALRRNVFLKSAVSSLKAYWETVSKDLPAMVIVVDHIEPLFENYMEVSEILTEIATSGAAFGIYLLFSANSTMGISYKFLQLIKGSIALQLMEKGDYGSIVGPISGISLPQFPGRALFKGNPPVAFQTFMYMDEKNEKERSTALAKLLDSMVLAYRKVQRKEENGVPLEDFSQKVTGESMDKKDSPASKVESQKLETKPVKLERGQVLIGKSVEDLEPVYVDLMANPVLRISAESSSRRAAFFEEMKEQLIQNAEHQILVLTPETAGELQSMLEENLNNRKQNLKKHKKDEDFDQAQWLTGFTQLCILIPDLEALSSGLEDSARKFYRRVITMGDGLGVSILAASSPKSLQGAEADLLLDAFKDNGTILALEGRPSDHVAAGTLSDPEAEVVLDSNEAAWIHGSQLQLIRRS